MERKTTTSAEDEQGREKNAVSRFALPEDFCMLIIHGQPADLAEFLVSR
jgi:hypothetical protein